MSTADEIVNRHWPEQPEVEPVAFERSWQPVDLSTVLDGGWSPPQPTVGARSDGVMLFYPGKVHTISSETEGGKTWLALAATIDELMAGNHVVYIDFEDNEGTVVGRLRELQVSPELIAERFHYVRPSAALGTGINLDDLRATLTNNEGITLAILDGVTEAMALHSLNPLDNRDIAVFGTTLPRRIAAHGPAVVCLDHVVKNADQRGRYALGGVHKLNALDGAAFLLRNREPFGIGLVGKSEIVGAKDRNGQLRRHGVGRGEGQFYFGDLILSSHYEGFAEVTIEPPSLRDETWRPTELMQRVAEALTQHGELSSKNMIATAVTGKKQTVLKAIDFLILDGFVTEKSPYKLLRPYP